MPLEALVEQERVHPAAGRAERLLLAAESGLHFLRLLKQKVGVKYHKAYLTEYPFPKLEAAELRNLDDASRRFLELVSIRTPNGARLFRDLNGVVRQGALPIKPPIEAADAQAVHAVAEAWLNWRDALFREPAEEKSAWLPERMEHAFSVAGRLSFAGERVLTAREYYDGRLDWHAFNTNPGASLGAATEPPAPPFVQTMIPAPVSYRGMPAQRWWEFEDAAVDFGAIEAGPADLVKMLLVEFAVSYGNDWFVVPMELPIGSLCKIHSLVVTDTFGVRSVVKSSADLGEPHASWRMFRLSSERRASFGTSANAPDVFFLPPALPGAVEGPPIEEVLFLRDEMANLAWGVERVVESLTGRPMNRRELYQAQQRRREKERETQAPATEAAKTGALVYHLATSVPDYWIPLIPKQIIPGQPDIRLVRGAMLGQDGTREVALSRILTPDANQPLAIYEEEIPREGVRVTRGYQLARWLDGSTHLWIGRRKVVGSGEGSSGLRFDLVETK